MLESTVEYLEALRRHDFLLAVEWVTFVRQRYPGTVQNGDTLLPLCIYELLNHGFTPFDMPHFEVLCSLLFEGEGIFRHLDYDATTLFNAGLQAMVWINAHVAPLYYHPSEPPLETTACLALMNKTSPDWSDRQNSEATAALLDIVKTRSQGQSGRALEALRHAWRVPEVRQTITAYITALEGIQSTSFSVDSRLQELRNAQALFVGDMEPDAFNARVQALATTLRGLTPQAFEEEYLNVLVPLPKIDITASLHRAGTRVVGFFAGFSMPSWPSGAAASSNVSGPSGTTG